MESLYVIVECTAVPQGRAVLMADTKLTKLMEFVFLRQGLELAVEHFLDS